VCEKHNIPKESIKCIFSKDDCKRIEESTRIIVADDCDFRDFSRENKIALLEFERATSINTRFKNAYLPMNSIKIGALNDIDGLVNVGNLNSKENAGVVRRICPILLSSPLLKEREALPAFVPNLDILHKKIQMAVKEAMSSEKTIYNNCTFNTVNNFNININIPKSESDSLSILEKYASAVFAELEQNS
jgi:hypothetical protein